MYEEALEELKAIKEAKTLKFGEFSKQMADFYKQLGNFIYQLVLQVATVYLNFFIDNLW